MTTRSTPSLGGAAGRIAVGLCGLMLMTACTDSPPTRAGTAPAVDANIGPLERPPVVDPAVGTCYARDTTPAVIETVTEQVMVQPAIVRSDGSVESPAAFRTVTRQAILRERREVEFETPCRDIMTPQFIASVQRALLARGYYRGSITGEVNSATSRAIGRFQTDQGDVATDVLTLRTARTLGLVALPRDQL